PLALRVGRGARGLGVPPDELLLLAPGLPVRVRRRSVVEDPPVGRPGERPAVTERILLVRRLAAGRLVDELALRRLVHDAGVDPASRRGRAVVLEVAEGRDGLVLLVLELAVGARDVLGRVAVDLLEDQLHLRMIRMLAVREVRGEETLVARLLRARVELL